MLSLSLWKNVYFVLPVLDNLLDFIEISNILEPIMFADDTNLFYSHKNLKTLFNIVNIELNKLNNWYLIYLILC